MNLLHIDSSLLGDASATRELTAALVARLAAADPDTRIVHRDLAARPLRHLDAAILSGTDSEAAAEAAQVLEEFLAAETIVIGAPMYNFSIPSTLKAWIDRISVAGRTFRYTAAGPEGLAGGRRVIVALAAGGLHAGQPTDFVEPYLRQVFAFLGIDDVRVLRADGVALSPEHRRAAIDRALDAASPLARAA